MHEVTSVSYEGQAVAEPHLQAVPALFRQQCEYLSSPQVDREPFAFVEHSQVAPISTQVTCEHEHLVSAAGHPASAQQRAFSKVAVPHGVEFGVLKSLPAAGTEQLQPSSNCEHLVT